MSTNSSQLKDFSLSILKKESIYHFVFWMILYSILIYVAMQDQPLVDAILQSFIGVLFFAIIVYVNTLYLVPKFLNKDQIVIYLIYLTLTALALTPINIFLKYLVNNDYGNLQFYFTQNQKALFLSCFFVGLASTLFQIVNDWSKHQRKMNILKSQSLESELRFLKSQINPHFLFNTLNSLYALTLKKSDNAPETVLKLSEMMRYMLYECNVKYVSLRNEVNYLQNYLELEKLRHSNDTIIEFDIDGEITDQKIAPLIFMTFMENAFKHGLSNQLEGHYVKIQLLIEENSLHFNIENSNAPKSVSYENSKNRGIGLRNIKRRLTLIYPKKHKLRILNTTNKYDVKLELQLDTLEEQND